MDNKPDSNNSSDTSSSPPPAPPPPVGGDSIVIQGSVGPGANVGSGSVKADQIAGHDVINIGGAGGEEQQRFADKMVELRELIAEARSAGELDTKLADEALANLDEVAQALTTEPKPDKKRLLSKLAYIGDILDTAADLLEASGGVTRVLVRAVPIAALLIKIASRIF
ncbi:MAG: hypothetical protein Kow00124_12650 [Anaerolineae bacterium]